MHACLRRTRKRVARVCEMMSMKGGGDRCECAECPEFLRVVGRRTVTMYVSNGRFFHWALESSCGTALSRSRVSACITSLLSSHSAPSSHTAAELSRSADACYVGSWQQVWHRRGRRRRVHN
jgi:hypothetical protein